MTATPTLLAVAHGTRDPRGAAATEALIARTRALHPEIPVRHCYLDLLAPSLPEALAGLTGEVIVVPLLLGTGYHIRVDIPAALADAPHLHTRIARALGPDPLLADVLTDRLHQAGWRPDDHAEGGALVLAAAGSTDPRANADTVAMAELLRARLPQGGPVMPAYLCAAGPTPAEAVAALRAAGHPRIALAEYLLGPGLFARRAARSGACLTTAPLGTHDAVAHLIARRYEEAVGELVVAVSARNQGMAARSRTPGARSPHT
ncbi:sirohydrochlorin chelatase [Streptomyces sp. NPDC056149]|uniref:sirohydrochlorin chelatase n=1 Tax=unclassified Streptomyces TaxID=2593676 RepID=UPI00238164F6|nr:sirohydrochlorin chelatase [Streptomyces sp. WZ-12]